MTSRTKSSYVLIAGITLLSSGLALAQSDTAQSAPSPAARQQMAAVHEKMAACLKSDQPMSECRAEMWKSCNEMKEAGCPMMDSMGGGMGPGMMGGGRGRGMMQGSGQSPPTQESSPQ
jgi:hypothetical protein